MTLTMSTLPISLTKGDDELEYSTEDKVGFLLRGWEKFRSGPGSDFIEIGSDHENGIGLLNRNGVFSTGADGDTLVFRGEQYAIFVDNAGGGYGYQEFQIMDADPGSE